MNKPQTSQTQYSFIFYKFSFFITNSLVFRPIPRFYNLSNMYFNEIIVIQDSIQFIKHVKKHGHKIAIVTNSNRTIATKVLEHIGIIDIIDLIVVGSECDKPKPYPDPYLKAMKFFNIPSNKTFIFEDSQTGLLSAKHSYPKCIIGVDYFGNNEKCMRNNGANIVIPNFSCEKLYSNIMEFNNNDNESIINNIRNCLHKSLDIKEIICNNMTLKGGYISDVVCVDVVLTNNQILNMIFKKEANGIPIEALVSFH